VKRLMELNQPYPNVTRVEVIDRGERVFARYDVSGSEVHLQDGGRTLKIFMNGQKQKHGFDVAGMGYATFETTDGKIPPGKYTNANGDVITVR